MFLLPPLRSSNANSILVVVTLNFVVSNHRLHTLASLHPRLKFLLTGFGREVPGRRNTG